MRRMKPAAGGGFDLGAVEAGVAGTPFSGCVHHFRSVSSTNTLAIEAAQAGVATGVWVADEQTAGRGRSGHGWHSGAGDGLYVSALVRPRLFGGDVLKLSLAAGLAAKKATAQITGVEIDLRWPNDLMVTGAEGVERKFGGILTESAMEGREGAVGYAVIGIGMNLNQRAMPEELRAIATSLWMVCGESVPREALLIALLRALSEEVERLEAEVRGGRSPVESLVVRFSRASTWVHGLSVRVAEGDGYTGETAGLDAYGLLRVLLADGTIRTVRHGGVRRLEKT